MKQFRQIENLKSKIIIYNEAKTLEMQKKDNFLKIREQCNTGRCTVQRNQGRQQ